jgi:hypothetical protein
LAIEQLDGCQFFSSGNTRKPRNKVIAWEFHKTVINTYPTCLPFRAIVMRLHHDSAKWQLLDCWMLLMGVLRGRVAFLRRECFQQAMRR